MFVISLAVSPFEVLMLGHVDVLEVVVVVVSTLLGLSYGWWRALGKGHAHC